MNKLTVARRGIGAAIRHARKNGQTQRNARPHTIRLYAKLVNNRSTIKFEVDDALAKRVNPMANGLLERDAFISTFAALGIHKSIVSGGTEYYGNTPMYFYPDANNFNGAAASGGVASEAQCLELLYNGLLMIKTNQDVRLEDYETCLFRHVTETQQSAATVPSFDENVFRDLGRKIAFAGGDSSTITIDYSDRGDHSAIAGDPATGNNYACLLLYGTIIKSGAQKRTV